MYKSEKDFSSALVLKLKKQYGIVQRIESAITGTGIPDLYIRHKDYELWIELKNHNWLLVGDGIWKIDWGAGQQAWAQKFLLSTGRHTVTIVSMKNNFIFIPMVKMFDNNMVEHRDVQFCSTIGSVANAIRMEALIA